MKRSRAWSSGVQEVPSVLSHRRHTILDPRSSTYSIPDPRYTPSPILILDPRSSIRESRLTTSRLLLVALSLLFSPSLRILSFPPTTGPLMGCWGCGYRLVPNFRNANIPRSVAQLESRGSVRSPQLHVNMHNFWNFLGYSPVTWYYTTSWWRKNFFFLRVFLSKKNLFFFITCFSFLGM
ncbi:hypothetical protein GGS21DRAFT_502956 [Xylaria nigripes]|nr:hypothetical protein GGS21DRAFT_502956 [Xylaria nigripes]